MISFYIFPFLDANDFDEVGDKGSLYVYGKAGLPLRVHDAQISHNLSLRVHFRSD
jgi:hypothetical protein